MGKTVRLSDIARRASVSTVTVSKALSGQKGVSTQKREQIEALAREMGYQKNTSSGGQKKGYTLGVIASEKFLSSNQSFYWAYYQEISKCATKRGNLLVLKVVSAEEEDRMEIPAMVSEGQVRGIIFLGTFRKKFGKLMADETKVPHVFVDSAGPSADCDSVVTDNLRMAFRMTNYLFEMGHRKIGFVGTRTLTDTVDDRYLGYIKSLLAHGVKYNRQYVLDDRDVDTGAIDPEQCFVYDRNDMPTAYLCSSDATAGVMSLCLQKDGFSVPDDISIAGFEDFLPERMAGVALTSCRVKVEEIAEKALYLLVSKIEGTRYLPGTFEVPGDVTIRGSVKKIGSAVPFV